MAPATITGSLNLRRRRNGPRFEFREGPVFHQPAAGRRDQPDAAQDAGPALLEAMEERQVSVDGERPGRCRSPFPGRRDARNPVEYEGTYPAGRRPSWTGFLPQAHRGRCPEAGRRDRHPEQARGGLRPAGTWDGRRLPPRWPGFRRPGPPPGTPVAQVAPSPPEIAGLHRGYLPGPPGQSASLQLGVSPARRDGPCCPAAGPGAWLSGRDYGHARRRQGAAGPADLSGTRLQAAARGPSSRGGTTADGRARGRARPPFPVPR